MVQTFLRRPQVERATGLSRSTLYALMGENKFPKPVPIGAGRAVGWIEGEIAAWQQSRIAERDRQHGEAA